MAAAKRLIAKALERRPEEIPVEGTVETVPGWDSLGHVKIIMTLEEELGRMLEPLEAGGIRGVSDVARLMDGRS